MAVAFLCTWNLQLRMKWPLIREFLCSLYCCLWEINFSFIPWEINKWSALSMAFLKDFFSFKVVVEQHTGNSIKSCSHSPCCSRVPSRALPEKKKKGKSKIYHENIDGNWSHEKTHFDKHETELRRKNAEGPSIRAWTFLFSETAKTSLFLIWNSANSS